MPMYRTVSSFAWFVWDTVVHFDLEVYSRAPLTHWVFQAAPGLQVYHVARLICGYGQLVYELNDGFGRRIWM